MSAAPGVPGAAGLGPAVEGVDAGVRGSGLGTRERYAATGFDIRFVFRFRWSEPPQPTGSPMHCQTEPGLPEPSPSCYSTRTEPEDSIP